MLTEYGPCPTCGKMFKSYRPKIFCEMKCYLKSSGFQAQIRKQARHALETKLNNKGMDLLPQKEISCLECGKKFFVNARRPGTKFCSKIHYRQYQAKRFDRWIGSPETIALPRNYDEFLTRDELHCLVDGCDWVGEQLSSHMNLTHGVPADEFKRAAGFNQRTGVLTPELSAKFSQRPHLYENTEERVASMLRTKQNYEYLHEPHSLESREHQRKSYIIQKEFGLKPKRVCIGCGKEFEQSSPFGKAQFCTIPCREQFYKRTNKWGGETLTCYQCKNNFIGSHSQTLRNKKGLPIACSIECKNSMNGSKPKKNFKIQTV